jgi:hypothetical protein
MRLVEDDKYLVVAFHAVRAVAGAAVVVCVPSVVEDDNLLNRLEDVVGIELQEDCHLRRQDFVVQKYRELTSITIEYIFVYIF